MTTSNIRVIRYRLNEDEDPRTFVLVRTPETDAIPDEQLIVAIKAR